MMISPALLGYCLLCGGGYLVLVFVLFEWLSGKLGLMRMIPSELVEPTSTLWRVMNFLMEFIFFVVVPTLVFGFLEIALPFTSVRAGVAAALFAIAFGAAPALMTLTSKIRLPLSLLMFLMLGMLIKLAGTLAIISYLHSL